MSILIEARNVELSIPAFSHNDRSILKKPHGMISDLYFGTTRRYMKVILSKVNLSVANGDRIGLIGLNGAGKTTLLRLLAGIYQPTNGTIEINGTVKGLFDITLGMLPQATGLENIYLRGLQMGHSFREIRELAPKIIEFSELAPYIHQPHATYSAGMRLRLAFSISAFVEPDILLLDEWIGAGDARFRAKASDKMMHMIGKSRALVLASHNDNLIKKICQQAIVIDNGRIVFTGGVDDALAYYHEVIVNGQMPPQPSLDE